jgi:transposase InsO family protein
MWGRPGTKAVYITPGSPWENRYCESFNGSLRDECLNVHWFESMEEARARIEAWRID